MEHGGRLGLYSFLYKLIVCGINRLTGKNCKYHHLLAGMLAGFIVFSNIKSVVNK
jgi:hypothetical protein